MKRKMRLAEKRLGKMENSVEAFRAQKIMKRKILAAAYVREGLAAHGDGSPSEEPTNGSENDPTQIKDIER